MKKLSLILLLSLGSQPSLFGSEEATSYNPITDYCSSLKDAILKRMPNLPSFMKKEEVVIPKNLSLKDKIVTKMSNGASFIKDQAHVVAAKTVSAKDAIVTKYSGEISYIKDYAQNAAEKATTLIKDNPKASIACGVTLVAGAAYLLYRKYKTKKTPQRSFTSNDRPDGETAEEYQAFLEARAKDIL
ncbi:hypothetical protein K9K77_02810 [Candidatus Babeliales bacterium]|nr:hypothetical protein [Candidatus Babeliales bacterium]